MAEIKIEKKKPIWPWILLAAVIIAILIFIFAFNGDDDVDIDERQDYNQEQTYDESGDSTQYALNNTEVATYVTFIQEDPDAMGLNHDFTNEALLKLTNATIAMADEIDYDIQKDIAEVKTYADKITTDTFETTHANSIKKSAEILANIMQNIQQRAFSDLSSDAMEVQNAAKAIKADMLTLDQKTDVKNYFRESADLLEKMNNNSPQI